LVANVACEASIPRLHMIEDLEAVSKSESDVFTQVKGVELRDLSGPACTDTLGAIHKHEWNNGGVEVRFDLHALFLDVAMQRLVFFGKQEPCLLVQVREDVPCTSEVFTSVHPSTELANRHE